jgi:hypothetical protein
MQPKIIGGFGSGSDEQGIGCDKAANPVYLNSGTSFICYRMDRKIVLFILVDSGLLGCMARKVSGTQFNTGISERIIKTKKSDSS